MTGLEPYDLQKRDSEWVRGKVLRYRSFVYFCVAVPWVCLVIMLVLAFIVHAPFWLSTIFIFPFILLFPISIFMLIFWYAGISNVGDGVDLIKGILDDSVNGIWVKDYDPYSGMEGKKAMTVTFGSDGEKYPELFYITFRDDFRKRSSSLGGPGLFYPCYRISIPFGIRPRVLIFKDKIHCDDDEAKGKMAAMIKFPIPADYLITIQLVSGIGSAGENRLNADFYSREVPPAKILATIEMMNIITQACYVSGKVDSRPRVRYGPFAIVMMDYCSKCGNIDLIEDWNGKLKHENKTCNKCGGKVFTHHERWSQ